MPEVYKIQGVPYVQEPFTPTRVYIKYREGKKSILHARAIMFFNYINELVRKMKLPKDYRMDDKPGAVGVVNPLCFYININSDSHIETIVNLWKEREGVKDVQSTDDVRPTA